MLQAARRHSDRPSYDGPDSLPLQLILVAPDSRDDMDWANPRTAKNSFTHDWYHIEVRRYA